LMNMTLRSKRIREEHAARKFKTGDRVFDKVNPSGTLKEYYESEARERVLKSMC
jgi:hypothetical protein